MKFFRAAVASLSVLSGIILPGVVLAAGAPLTLTVNPARSDIFIPTSAWLVGPSSPAPAPPPAPCVMANQFDNGFLVRFSGGGRQLLAMALDVHQQAFNPGQPYLISLAIGDRPLQSISAQAYDAATLLVDLRKMAGSYDALRDGKILHLIVAGKTLDFALLGMDDGMNRLEACYGGGTTSSAAVSTAMTRPPPIALPDDVDPSYRSAVGNDRQARGPAADTNDDPAASLGMHTLITAPQPAGNLQVAQARTAPDAAAPADGGNPQGLIDRMLQKAASGLRGLSGGQAAPAGGFQDAMTPQGPKSATVTLAHAAADGTKTDPASVTPAAGGTTPSVQTVNGPLAGTWTSATVRRDSQGRDVIDGAKRSVPYAQDSPSASFHQPGGDNVGPDAQSRLQSLNYALPQ